MFCIILVFCLVIVNPTTSPDMSGRWDIVIPDDLQDLPNRGSSTWKEIRGTWASQMERYKAAIVMRALGVKV